MYGHGLKVFMFIPSLVNAYYPLTDDTELELMCTQCSFYWDSINIIIANIYQVHVCARHCVRHCSSKCGQRTRAGKLLPVTLRYVQKLKWLQRFVVIGAAYIVYVYLYL